jgi:uracil-DNA glycosylase
MNDRLTSRLRPYSEASATIVWKALHELRIEDCTILWNALQMHPYELGNEQSNRTPTSEEFEIGKRALKMLVRRFPSAKVVAVGRKAQKSLKSMDIPAEHVPHPANGGAAAFRKELKRLVRLARANRD